MSIFSYKDGYFTLNEKPFFLFSAEMHYSRVPEELWKDRILKIKQAFFNTFATYSFRNWHEPIEGQCDLSSFTRLLELCNTSNINLKVITRCGSYCCAEWDTGGYPSWLIPKNISLRTLTKGNIRIERTWHKYYIDNLKDNNLFYPDGPVILYQIENEFFWKNNLYLATLYKIASDLGVKVPIFTNENYFCAKTTPILHAIDLYPGPWELLQPILWMMRYDNQSYNRPKFIAELEGGWFTTYGKGLPTCRGKFPDKWTDFLTRFLIGIGINGISYYMFHGGTNFNYTGGGAQAAITTTYDYDACIREWGELSERYHLVKLLGGFLNTFPELAQTRPKTSLNVAFIGNLFRKLGILNNLLGIKKYKREGQSFAFFFVSNLLKKSKNTNIKYKGLKIPYEDKFSVDSQSIKIVPINIEKYGIKILYSTNHIYQILDQNTRILIICYEKAHKTSEIAFELEEEVKIEGAIKYIHSNKQTIIYMEHGKTKNIIIRTPKPIHIYPLTDEQAKRTWMIDKIPMISNIYFAYKEDSQLFLETDSSTNNFDLLTPDELNIYKNGEKISEFNEDLGSISGEIETDLTKVNIDITNLLEKRDGLETNPDFDDSNWTKIREIKPLEDLGIFTNGFTWYRSEFVPKQKPVILELGGNEFVHVFINGKCLGQRSWIRAIDISNIIKLNETNHLAILVESKGRRHHHPFNRSGLTRPVIIHNGNKKIIKMKFRFTGRWDQKKIPRKVLGPWIMPTTLLNWMLPMGLIPEEVHLSETLGMLFSFIDLPFTEGDWFWYKGNFKINLDDIKDNRIWLLIDNIGQDGYVWVNKQLVKKFVNHVCPNGIDITSKLHDGKNEILFAINNIGFTTLLKDIWIVKGNSIKDWRIQHKTSGELEKNFEPFIEINSWDKIDLPYKQKSFLAWYKLKFTVSQEENCIAPLKLILPKIPGTALIFLNGRHIGRYQDIGPQTEFYLPEPYIKINEENDITLMIDSYAPNKQIPGDFKIVPYYIHKSITIDLK